MQRLRAILALGRIAHDSVLSALGVRRAAHPFSHGAVHDLGAGRLLFDSYHCSRYNMNTRRLTVAMFDKVVDRAAEAVADAPVRGGGSGTMIASRDLAALTEAIFANAGSAEDEAKNRGAASRRREPRRP